MESINNTIYTNNKSNIDYYIECAIFSGLWLSVISQKTNNPKTAFTHSLIIFFASFL